MLSATSMNGSSKYRQLMRSVRFAFKSDAHAVSMARLQLREEFSKNAAVTDAKQLAELFKGVDEGDEMRRFNIVQGTLNERGNYDVSLHSEGHQTTVAAGQDNAHGVDLQAMDKSVTGNADDVVVTTTRKGVST